MDCKHLEKYSHPTKFDHHPFLTIWECKQDSESSWYIQVSKTDDMHWITLGEFLTQAFLDQLFDPVFLAMCFKLYQKMLTEHK